MRCAVFLLAACSLAACAERAAPPGLGFGNAVEHNISQHVIDPAPASAYQGAPPLDGRRAERLIGHYDSGTVIDPQALSLTDIGQGR